MNSLSKGPSVLILHASGTNRDAETARACSLAGAAPEIVHINQLRAGEKSFAAFDMLLLPGGFSYGDALGAGARMALDLRVYFYEALRDFVESGKPVLGICNGFQVLVKAGVFGEATLASDAQPAARDVTLTENASGHFECRWVNLAVEPNARAVALHNINDLVFCPVAHGEGNFQVLNAETLSRLEANGQVAFRYVSATGERAGGAYPLNPNGSAGDVAGLCNRRGNVVGLMPHPEDHVVPIQNPLRRNDQLGLRIFEAMVEMA